MVKNKLFINNGFKAQFLFFKQNKFKQAVPAELLMGRSLLERLKKLTRENATQNLLQFICYLYVLGHKDDNVQPSTWTSNKPLATGTILL